MKYAFPTIALCLLAACSQPQESGEETDVTAAMTPAATGAGSTSTYDGPIPMPILIGGDGPQMDACGTLAKVANLGTDGVNYLSVRDAPSTAVKERERLKAGRGVQVCATEGGWSGIVYRDEGDDAIDCGTGTPVATAQPYTGPCRQGWVESDYLEMVAG